MDRLVNMRTPLAQHMHLTFALQNAWRQRAAEEAERGSRYIPSKGYDEHHFREGGITQRVYHKLIELERANTTTLSRALGARSDHVAAAVIRLVAKNLVRRKRTGFYEIV